MDVISVNFNSEYDQVLNTFASTPILFRLLIVSLKRIEYLDLVTCVMLKIRVASAVGFGAPIFNFAGTFLFFFFLLTNTFVPYLTRKCNREI